MNCVALCLPYQLFKQYFSYSVSLPSSLSFSSDYFCLKDILIAFAFFKKSVTFAFCFPLEQCFFFHCSPVSLWTIFCLTSDRYLTHYTEWGSHVNQLYNKRTFSCILFFYLYISNTSLQQGKSRKNGITSCS